MSSSPALSGRNRSSSARSFAQRPDPSASAGHSSCPILCVIVITVSPLLPVAYAVGGFLLIGGVVLILADIISPIKLF